MTSSPNSTLDTDRERSGQEAECIKLTTAPPDYNPPQVEPEDLEQFSFNVVYTN
eukprot:SAG31_NODE_7962_length_1554_cov_16.543643_2_plen_54_part_00